MTRVRVALLANSLGVGGVERQLITLAERLDRSRFDVELWSCKPEGGLHEATQALSTWSPQAGRSLDLGALRRLRSRLRSQRVQSVLAANQYATLTLAAASVGLPSLRRLSAFHSSPDLIGPGLRDRVRLRLYGQALRGFDTLVYVSARQQQAWAARGFAAGVPSRVITNGIDVARYPVAPDPEARRAWGWNAGDLVVGLCATLRPEKRVEDLVQGVALARAQGVPARLLVVGAGPCRDAIDAAVQAHLPDGSARLVGFQPDVVPFLRACDAVALVSDSEAFSIAVLEAMACARPVLLTDVGGAAEQIEDGVHGHLLPRRSPAAIAQALQRLWQGGAAADMGRRARRRVEERFSLDAMVRGYEDLLQRVAQRPSPRAAEEAFTSQPTPPHP
jgi:glycosyltransferase involved in cell wall biosynthesis